MGLYRYIELGGVMMWPLLACSVMLLAVVAERLFVALTTGRAGLRGPGDRPPPMRRVLVFLTDVPPSLGLLGTVIGVVRSFNLTGGPINADTVGSGLAVACMTTLFGLGIAVVASASLHLLDALTEHHAELKR